MRGRGVAMSDLRGHLAQGAPSTIVCTLSHPLSHPLPIACHALLCFFLASLAYFLALAQGSSSWAW